MARWQTLPTAFFSVSLAAASANPDERAEPLRIARNATASAAWTPNRIESFAGVLKYSWLKRMLMKYIASKEGGATDTSRDFEYTSWLDVDRFVVELSKDIGGASS